MEELEQFSYKNNENKLSYLGNQVYYVYYSGE
ncbi:hypothetical protein JOD28_001480 [Leuconostoc rapi]|nr:hypothetical protein [Leuconostoc rapi]